MEKTIYDLDLHESTTVKVIISEKDGTYINYMVMRVPGGWIYRTVWNNNSIVSFVPFDTEFSKSHDENGRKLGNREK